MARGINGVVLGDVRTLFDLGAAGEMTDGQLLERFLDDRVESGGSAFGVLVDRHGPMVFGVCRRTLRHAQEAEDAFQATFLVLARRARSIRNREAVGPWLLGVARKVAARARSDAQRRRTLDVRPDESDSAGEATSAVDGEEIAALLSEVERLPRRLREPLVLCYLQGMTYSSAADALRLTEGTVRGRLVRAKESLRVRLTRRGFSPASLAPMLVDIRILEEAPRRLIEPTVRASMRVAAGESMAGVVSTSAASLMEGVLKTMLSAKLKTTAALALTLGMIGLGTGVHARQKPVEQPAENGAQVKKSGVPAAGGEMAGPDAAILSGLVGGRIVRTAEVTKDSMILSYLPDWGFGNVDNIGIAGNDGGVRTLVDWPDVPASESKSPELRFYLAFFSRKTTSKPKPGMIGAFELSSEWPEPTSWRTRPSYEPEPIAREKFSPGDGWKVFEITEWVRSRGGNSGQGLMLRFLVEDRPGSGDWSGYECVSREGQGEWAHRRPMLLVVGLPKK